MFFKKNNNQNDDLSKVAALLIYAAKIDENYSPAEEEIIKRALLRIGASSENVGKIIADGKKIEEDSNQILDFTKEVKNMEQENKIKIIETLWRIIYSNNDADMYETNLMRRLTGLLYVDNKLMGDIKDKIKKEISK
ncbi:MAG: TerB family tellurite resistance protein [Candidatus Pelagibacter sp.]|tara:strand:+ start:64 stop:474 length:411 start_codon:yes stop_codon:yes gene_type:complete